MERFHGQWTDLDGVAWTGNLGRETCLETDDALFCGFTPFLVDHDCDEPQTAQFEHAGCRNRTIQTICPHLPSGTCTDRLRVTQPGFCYYVDFDCDRCTPNVRGGETLVRWANIDTRVSPRPIARRTTPGDRRVVIEWDNAAELPTATGTLPPVSGYRLWRADGWSRPPGASGPAEDLWRLVAELALPGSGLPEPSVPFIVDGVAVIDSLPGPGGTPVPHYEVGRYRYADEGVPNGFAVFYDVTPFSVEPQPGGTMEVHGLSPRATSGEEVYPIDEVAAATSAEIRVVPNPYVESAAWDLEPNRLDPSGRKMAFTGLPALSGQLDIFTLAGDRVRTLEHHGSEGAVYWDLLSRNGQPVASGIYIYVFEADGVQKHGKLVIVR
jgi:hypothetical protein